MKKIVIVDNYDSFTYNLAHAIKALGAQVDVFRNDCLDFATLGSYDKIILSPGPGIPEEAGDLLKVISVYSATKPILGICLGEQAIGQAFGGSLVNLKEVYHGVQTPARIVADDYLFEGLPNEIEVGRYHSWVVSAEGFPNCLEVTAVSPDAQIMALRHKKLDIRGLQFHPESVLTADGTTILKNWLNH